VIVALRIAAALIALVVLGACERPRLEGAGAEGPSSERPRLPGDLRFGGISVVGDEVGKPRFSLVADSVRYQHRMTQNGLFTYQNLTELHLSGVRAELYPPQPASEEAGTIDLLGALSLWMGPIAETDGGPAKTPEIESRVLSRTLFERISIRIHVGDRGVVAIEADRGRGTVDLEALLFHGRVVVVDTAGRTLRAPRAIWSDGPAGVYLPEGHELDGETARDDAFFAIDRRGELVGRDPIPEVAYRDRLVELEDRIFEPGEDALIALIFGSGTGLDARARTSENTGSASRH